MTADRSQALEDDLDQVAERIEQLPGRRLELMTAMHGRGYTVTRIAELARLSRQQVSTTLNREP